MKKKILEQLVRESTDTYVSAIDQILGTRTKKDEEGNEEPDVGYETYKNLRDELIKESYRLRQMFNLPIKEIFDKKPFNESIILESARMDNEIAEGLLSEDDVKHKVAMLEAYLIPKKILESYVNETNDLGIELQKSIVRGLAEKLVIEAKRLLNE